MQSAGGIQGDPEGFSGSASPWKCGSPPHTGIPKPEQQRREGEFEQYLALGITGDLLHLEDSDHTIPGKARFLCYNISLESSLFFEAAWRSHVAEHVARGGVCSVQPAVTLRGSLYPGRTLGRERDGVWTVRLGKEDRFCPP